jgi:hypothetical protein
MTKEHQTSTSNPSSFEPQRVGTQRQQLKFDYRIRHTDEVHERIANERELSIAQDVATTAEIIEYMAIVLDPGPVGEGWRVRIYPPGTNSALPEYATPRRQLLKRQRRSSMHTAAQFEMVAGWRTNCRIASAVACRCSSMRTALVLSVS